jgi:DNA-directed RNA polymerase alpha subunit
MRVQVTICDLCSQKTDESVTVCGTDVCASCQQRPIADLVPLLEARRATERERQYRKQARPETTWQEREAQRAAGLEAARRDPENSVEALGLLPRAHSALQDREGIFTIGDLTRRSEQDLLDIKGIGIGTVAQITTALAGRGLALADGVPAVVWRSTGED